MGRSRGLLATSGHLNMAIDIRTFLGGFLIAVRVR